MSAKAQEFIELINSDPELRRVLQEQLVDADAIRRALRDPNKRDEIRTLVLGEEWVNIPTILRQLVESHQRHEAILQEHSRILQEHSRILQEHTQQLAMLIETVQRHEAILREHTNLLMQMKDEIQEVSSRLFGLQGRIEGERYERETVRRAPNIFLGGGGGSTDRPHVMARLRQWLRPIRREKRLIPKSSDPYLADLIWWKDSQVLVGEISLAVDRLDVDRAKQRAQTLREMGVNATPVVIGEIWANPDVQDYARLEQVEWIVENQFSEGMMRYRQMPEADGDDIEGADEEVY